MIYYGLVVAGTDTGVGKTELACGLAKAFFKKGIKVGVFKPVETGCREEQGELIAADGLRLLQASGAKIPMEQVVPYRFALPAAPLAASRAEGREVLFEKLYQVFDELAGEFELMIVEGAGGALVPVNENFLFADLIKPMHLPVLVVAENKLGAINQTLLTIESLRSRGLELLGIVLNQTRRGGVSEEILNPELIERFGKVKVLCRIGYLEEKDRTEVMAEICGELAAEIEPVVREFGRKTVLNYF